MRVLGLEQNALVFYEALMGVDRDYAGVIGARSLMFWRRAAFRRLALAPNEDDEEAVGQLFLRELDEENASVKEAAEAKAKE